MRDLALIALGAAAGALLAYPTALVVARTRSYAAGYRAGRAAGQTRARVEHYARGWADGYDASECRAAEIPGLDPDEDEDGYRDLALLRLAVHAKHDAQRRGAADTTTALWPAQPREVA
jgi:hypothetical protein